MPSKINKPTLPTIMAEKDFNSGIDLAAIIAKRAESLLLGNGYELKEVEKSHGREYDEVAAAYKDQNLIGILADSERKLSMTGEQGVIQDYDGNGNLRFTLPETISIYYTTTSGQILGARTYRKIVWGNLVYLVIELWGNTGVKRTITGTRGVVIPIDVFNNEVSPELQVDEFWDYSALGRIPIILFQNLNSIGNKSEPDGASVKSLQPQLDHALYVLYKELEMTRTRYGIDRANVALTADIQEKGLFPAIRDSVIIGDFDGSSDNPDDTGLGVQVITSDFKGEEYEEIIKFYTDLYFDGCGYSTLNDSQAATTVVGTLYTNRKDMETTKRKLKIRESQLEDFAELTKDMLGHQTLVLIKLKTNILFDEQAKLEYIRIGDELGILTEDRKISLYYGITDQEEIDTIKATLLTEEDAHLKRINAIAEASTGNADDNDSDDSDDNDSDDKTKEE